MSLAVSKTLQNLAAAFAMESRAGRRALRLVAAAEAEGRADEAALLRSTAEGRRGHAQGHLAFMDDLADGPADSVADSLKTVAGDADRHAGAYAGMARTAREEGLEDVADWFETLAKAEAVRADRLRRALSLLD